MPLSLKAYLNRKARENARRRMARLVEYFEGSTLLDLGAAEGWSGEFAAEHASMQVQLLDVVDLNRTQLPHTLYDGHTLPFADNAFDTVTIMLTLHHCTEPTTVLKEAIRVARRRIIITESVYRTAVGKALLTLLDGGYNGLRSNGRMPPALHFNTAEGWKHAFAEAGVSCHDAWETFRWFHRQHGFVLEKVSKD